MYKENKQTKSIASLAPMAGVADRAFREICSQFGVSRFTSEMISAKGLIYGSSKTNELLTHSDNEKPFSVQLFGNDPESFSEAVKIVMYSKPDCIDINMGCPAPKIISSGAGSALMKDPKLCGRIVKAVKDISPVPVTVKIRSGWDEENINAPEIAKVCEFNGADAITIHGRSRSQMYSGKASLETIRKVVSSVKIPVTGNGDILSCGDALHMIEYTGCHDISVGRGALGAPWIFEEINSAFKGKIFLPPSLHEKILIMKDHIEKLCSYKGEARGMKEARRHISWYLKGINGASKIRKLAFSLSSINEFLEFCNEIDNVD